MRTRLECRNVKIDKILKRLVKFGKCSEYKVWEYNNIVYLALKTGSISDLKELVKRLKSVCELRFSRVDYNLPWWKKWMR
jgi:hypothetical protein